MLDCYCTLLRTANRKVGAVYDEALAPLGINIAQYFLLKNIQRLQPVNFTELGRDAELDRSTVGRNVRVLGRMELIETAKGEDRREVILGLTPRGAQVLDEGGPLLEACQQEFEMRFGPMKLTEFQEILRSI